MRVQEVLRYQEITRVPQAPCVIEVGEAAWEEPPPTLTGDQAKVVRGVYKLDDRLMLVLRTDAVVDVSANENTGNRTSN